MSPDPKIQQWIVEHILSCCFVWRVAADGWFGTLTQKDSFSEIRRGEVQLPGRVNVVLVVASFDSLDWLTNVLFDGWLANGICTFRPEFVTVWRSPSLFCKKKNLSLHWLAKIGLDINYKSLTCQSTRLMLTNFGGAPINNLNSSVIRRLILLPSFWADFPVLNQRSG